tara:strand:- start:1115 stop:2704 length:1590 start_codon:yes stop_codon:yes gene_type:complete
MKGKLKNRTQNMSAKNSLIAGNWEEGKGDSFASYNPANQEKLADYKGVNTAQIDAAVQAASKAFSIFKSIDFDARAQFIDDVASEIEALGDELLETCNNETGLGIPRITGERGRTCGQLRAFADLVRKGSWQQARIDTALPNRTPLPKPDIRSVLRPLGPVAVFSASNFPLAFATLGGDTASALASGNPVVVKGHPSHPGTSALCAKAIERAIEKNNLPKGLFSLVQGGSPSVSSDLVKHPKIEAVGFTGSTYVGRILFDLGASRPKPIPVFAEMGSSNPLFVLPKAIKNRGSEIANGLAGSITLGTGQFCTKPGLVFLLKSENAKVFKDELKKAIQAIQIGNFLNARIKSSLDAKLHEFTTKDNLSVIAGGTANEGTLLTISGSEFIRNPDLEDEMFGPAALIIECENIEELLNAAKQLGGHLTGTLHSDDDAEAVLLKEILEEKVGRIVYNGFPTGVEVCPSMHHSGPYPSSTSSQTTSVGTSAITRFCTVVCYQNAPQEHLPEALKDKNSRGIMRLVNGEYTTQNV